MMRFVLIFAVGYQQLLQTAAFLRITSNYYHQSCRSGLYNLNHLGAEATTSPTSSSEWYNVPRNSLLADASILRGCDAIISTLNNDDNSIHPSVWARTLQTTHQPTDKLHSLLAQQQHNSQETSVPNEAIQAIEATHRWSENFVRQLSLCPWAPASLDTVGAIRYWVLVVENDSNNYENNDNNADSVILDQMEDIVRKAGSQLKQITSHSSDGENDDSRIDPNVAISFVILVDAQLKQTTATSSEEKSFNNILPDFTTFHEFFLDLEDRLLDECDDYMDSIADDMHDSDECIGCDITIAAFHRQWQFFGNTDTKNDDTEQPIDYEKRTPYPTISIVMTEAIDTLMNEDEGIDGSSALATRKIAKLNEKTLESIGLDRLKEMFKSEVLQCPMKSIISSNDKRT